MYRSLWRQIPVNSLRKKPSSFCFLGIKACTFFGSAFKQFWMKDGNCNKALSPVIAGKIFKNVKHFNKILIDSTTLELKCLGLRHQVYFAITRRLLSKGFAAAATKN